MADDRIAEILARRAAAKEQKAKQEAEAADRNATAKTALQTNLHQWNQLTSPLLRNRASAADSKSKAGGIRIGFFDPAGPPHMIATAYIAIEFDDGHPERQIAIRVEASGKTTVTFGHAPKKIAPREMEIGELTAEEIDDIIESYVDVLT